jgi:hypothetical protein
MRSSFLDLGQDRFRKPETGLKQAIDGGIEIRKTGPIGFIKNGEGARDLESTACRLLPTCLVVDEHHVGLHLYCESNGGGFSGIQSRDRGDGLRRLYI